MANRKINRREFLARTAAAGIGAWALGNAAFSCHTPGTDTPISGRLMGPDFTTGHRLRGGFPAHPNISRKAQTGILIIGAGIAGLACAWQLRQRGFHDFLVMDLEPEAGGNARGGEMNGLVHPLGAHYLPVPDRQNAPLVQFLQEVDVVKGFDLAGRPVFNELHLCHAPEERLLMHGVWQPSLVPNTGLSAQERDQIHRFFELMRDWKQRMGKDGLPAFAIPAAHSSMDPEIRALDQLTLSTYLHDQGLDAPALLWYIDYCCRDDFGLTAAQCSAWAGIHYFAARKGGGANAESGDVLTWPEGNAWLAKKLFAQLEPAQWLPQHMAARVSDEGTHITTMAFTAGSNDPSYLAIESKAVVMALPLQVAGHILPGLTMPFAEGTPWLVANLRVALKDNPLLEGLSWDNVAYGRNSLGYVHARHQGLHSVTPEETVLTWYEPLTDMPPRDGRRWLLQQDHAALAARVLADMQYIHPGLQEHLRAIDVWRWGHGMAAPRPGIITSPELLKFSQPMGRIHFAHSDLSGYSVLEEAFHHGHRAAEAAWAMVTA